MAGRELKCHSKIFGRSALLDPRKAAEIKSYSNIIALMNSSMLQYLHNSIATMFGSSARLDLSVSFQFDGPCAMP